MMKKILAALLALTVAAASMTGCAKDNGAKSSSAKDSSVSDVSSSAADSSSIDVDKLVIPEKKLVIDGEEVDTDGLVMMTINDKYEISFDEYRYFYYLILRNTGLDFNNIDEEYREQAFADLISTVEMQIKNFYSYFLLADDLGIEFTADDENSIEVKQQENEAQFDSAEDCEKYYESMYANSDVVRQAFRQEVAYNKATDVLFGEGGKYYVSKEDFLKFALTDEYAQVKHVLVTFASQSELSDSDMAGYDDLSLSEKLQLKETAYQALTEDEKKLVDEKAKTEIEAVLEKVKAGEDFDELVKTYGWDPGMEQTPEGYFITENTNFVPEFIEAAFKLKPGETSDIVESSYGYHILKREQINEDYLNEHADELYEDYFSEIMDTEGSKLLNDIYEKTTVTKSEYIDKLTYDSIS